MHLLHIHSSFMKLNRVIAAFPGTGKSYFAESYSGVSDSDSSAFFWQKHKDKPRIKIHNPEFPINYIKHIKDNVASIILVSTHKKVIDALVNHGIKFTLVYPDKSLEQEYIQRFKDRKSSDDFVKLMENKWNEFIERLEQQEGSTHITLQSGQYLSDVINT